MAACVSRTHPAKAGTRKPGSLLLHSASPRLSTYRNGGLTNGIGERSADDQMTEKRKLFKTLITRLMLVYTFGCFHGRAPTQNAPAARSLFVASGSKLTHLPAALTLIIQKNNKFYIGGMFSISTHERRASEMSHKAPLLWILLQFAAALLSSVRGENAVLQGKKLLFIFIQIYKFKFIPPSGINSSNVCVK